MWSKSKIGTMLSVVAATLSAVHAEVFTAISDVEPLLDTHQRVIDDLDRYIDMELERLQVLEKQLDTYKGEQMKAMEDIPNYLGNPINAYTLIKRLTIDLDAIEEVIRNGTNILLKHVDERYPTLEDLTGAAQALTRLQETYLLEISDLSEGILNGVIHRSDDPSSLLHKEAVSTPLSAGDCYELGRILYGCDDYKNALSWMMEAYRKFRDEARPYHFTEVDILDYISHIHYLLDDTRTALEWTKQLLTLDPKHLRAHGNIIYYEKEIAEHEEKLKRSKRDDGVEEKVIKKLKPTSWVKKHSHDPYYEALCRGELEIPTNISKSLKCRYLTENHPFLKLAPIKMEQLYMNPDIMVFYDVISDDEIQKIKELAKPKFARAKVHGETGIVPVDYRISKLAWLYDEHEPVVMRLTQRIADFTGLSMETAEHLQVSNYGIGGHYEPHYDFARSADKVFTGYKGNRIATVLFYMSDVAQGGATVFTELGLSVFPVARSAAFWHNLHPSCEGDLATRHAACPVLRGSKWVCNKWIHQDGQELLRPCNLEYQQEGIAHPIPKPVLKSVG